MTITGHGAGYRPRHFSDLMKLGPDDAPQWLEVLSENFMGTGGKPLRNLMALREKFPLCLHGVSMSIAGQDPFRKDYLYDLKKLIELTNPVYVSDHLCWTSSNGHNSHDLLPVTFTVEALNHVCERIQIIQDHLDRTLLFENPSAYIAFNADEISEAEFLAEMCRRTGCGILLDVNNLFVNQMNLGTDVVAWLNRINPEWIGYIHMAGHSVSDGIRVDTHDQPVCPEVWDLFAYVLKKFGPIPSMIEWDGDVPEFSVMLQEILKLKTNSGREISNQNITVDRNRTVDADGRKDKDWRKVQSSFFAMVTSEASEHHPVYDLSLFRKNTPAASAVGAEVYSNAYLQRLTDIMRDAFPVLNKVAGRRAFDGLIRSYLALHPPEHYSVKFVAEGLKDFEGLPACAQQCGIDSRLLTDLVTLEWTIYDLTDSPGNAGGLDRSVLSRIAPDRWAEVRFSFHPLVVGFPVQYRVDQTLEKFRADESPSPPPAEPATLLVYRSDDEVTWHCMNDLEAALFKGIQEKLPFEKCCNLFQRKSGESIEDTVFRAVGIVGDWLDDGLIDKVQV